MSSLNCVHLIGRLGKNPEMRSLSSGVNVTNFSIATSETWKDKTTGEKKETTTWHNIVLWRGLADVAAKYLHKGDMVYIQGKITTRSWEKDGVKHYATDIVGDQMTMLGSKNASGQAPAPQAPPAGAAASSDDPFDNLPKSGVLNDDGGDLPF